VTVVVQKKEKKKIVDKPLREKGIPKEERTPWKKRTPWYKKTLLLPGRRVLPRGSDLHVKRGLPRREELPG